MLNLKQMHKKTKSKPTLLFKNWSCVRVSLCTTVVHNIEQNGYDDLPSYSAPCGLRGRK